MPYFIGSKSLFIFYKLFQILFPLFAQLDLPVMKAEGGAAVDYSTW